MSGYVSTALSVFNPANWGTNTNKKESPLMNATSRVAVASLGALAVVDSFQTVKTINVTRDDWQVTKIAKATVELAAGALALKAAIGK
jgi:hypothetical protein